MIKPYKFVFKLVLRCVWDFHRSPVSVFAPSEPNFSNFFRPRSGQFGDLPVVLFLLRGCLAWHLAPRGCGPFQTAARLVQLALRVDPSLDFWKVKTSLAIGLQHQPTITVPPTAIFVSQHKTSKKMHYDKFTAFHLWPWLAKTGQTNVQTCSNLRYPIDWLRQKFV